MRIIFMGTPEIAVYSLKTIDKNNHEIVAVVTAEDKPAGRGRKLKKSAVKEYAEKENIKILQPEKLKNENFINELKELNADLFVVVAFRMLPKAVWSLPKYGTINLHASLLPNYRGAAPINWAIINGETKTGVTTFFIDEKIDTGKIILQKEIEIEKTDNAGTLHDKIMTQGAELLLITIEVIKNKNYKQIPQENLFTDKMQLKPAPKIFKNDCFIDWSKPSDEIYNFIRGLNPYPGAWTYILKENKKYILKIFDVEIDNSYKFDKEKNIKIEKDYFIISSSKGALKVLSMQFEGKKRMKSADFLCGFDFSDCIIP